MLSKYRFLALVICSALLMSLMSCGTDIPTSDDTRVTISESRVENTEAEPDNESESLKSESDKMTEEKQTSDANTEFEETSRAETDENQTYDSESKDTEPKETEPKETAPSVTDPDETESKETVTETEKVTETETETKPEPTPMDDFTISESDGKASVKSPKGFEYTATGYTKVGTKGFAFEKDLVFDFGDQFNGSINRFTFDYESTVALKIYVTYTEDGKDTEEYYFLESGKRSFSGLTVNFLNGKKASTLKSVRVEALEIGDTEFVIYNAKVEQVSVPSKVIYIEGVRYKLGIDLDWGGAISYMSDKKNPIRGSENLINYYDTGRLVQQSYYGTGAIEGVFEWGSFNGSDQWPYNPVQGGDKGLCSSRLIDIVVESDYIYIKAQPMDWGKVGYITPSYMENTYRVEDDHVYVNNRFVDFSGWEHPMTTQELPAFYTISYLGTFVWYDGANPWTGDTLSSRDNLNFWGDSKYSAECSFRLKEPNTETWCAWVNETDNYGIGLYVPNVDYFKAGRSAYNGTKDPKAGPTNYVAPINKIQIVSFEALEYSYMMACGSVDEIRETFTTHKDFDANEGLNKNYSSIRQPYFEGSLESIDFTDAGNLDKLCYPNNTNISFDSDKNATKLTVEGSDPYVTIYYGAGSVKLFAEDFRSIEIVYMIPTSNSKLSYNYELFICAGEYKEASSTRRVTGSLKCDGRYHTLTVNLDVLEYWAGEINMIRFDYFTAGGVGDVIFVKSIKLKDSIVSMDMTNLDFTDELTMDAVGALSMTNATYDAENKAMKLEVTGNDPYFIIDYAAMGNVLSTSEYKKVRITYMMPTTNAHNSYGFHLFACAGSTVNPTGSAMVAKSGIVADGQYHTVEFDLSSSSFWNGDINKLRLDYFASATEGDVCYIKSIELVK